MYQNVHLKIFTSVLKGFEQFRHTESQNSEFKKILISGVSLRSEHPQNRKI